MEQGKKALACEGAGPGIPPSRRSQHCCMPRWEARAREGTPEVEVDRGVREGMKDAMERRGVLGLKAPAQGPVVVVYRAAAMVLHACCGARAREGDGPGW